MESKEPYTTTTVPLSPPPLYETPNLGARAQDVLNNSWVYEILASLISLVMLAAIFGVLHHYDSSDVDLWSHAWALSSLVGLLATISQTTLAVPLASCISQLKWTWYKESQKLTDLDKFEQSSRGPFGSVKLLFSRPFKFLGAFGAFLTILTLAFHTLIQNAISTRSGMLELDALYGDPLYGASYPQGNNYTMRYNDYSTYETLGDQGPTLDMVADITYGMYYTMMYNDTQTQLSIATCLTGNCTWRHIQTLGVCSKCADITSKIYDDTSNGIYTLYGNAVEMDQRAGLVTSLGNTLYPDPSVLPGVGPLIAHVTTMARANTSVFPTGIDCALYWCVVDQSNVIMTNWDITDAVYTNWTDPSTSAHTTYKQRTDIQLTPPTCYDKNARPISDTTKCTKTVSSHSQIALQNYFTGEKTGFTGMATQNLTTGGWNIGSEVMQLIYTTARISDDLATDMGIIMNNIGLLMTSNIRQTKPQNGFPKSLGEVWIWTTLYHIRWGYMVLPTLLVVASILFLIATIIKSWGHEKWKSSVLPLLFHPLADEVRPRVAPHKMSELKAIAENREVRLHRSHLGSQFV